MTNQIFIDGVSSNTYHLFFERLPMFPTAIENSSTVAIPGRNETLTEKSGSFNDITVPLNAYLVGFDIDEIKAWLHNGKKLVLENQPDRYARIKQVTVQEYDRVGNGALNLKITFKCSPFKYALASEAWNLNTFEFHDVPGNISVSGNYYAQPIMLVGDVTAGTEITLNGVKVRINSDYETVLIDTEKLMICQMLSDDSKVNIQNETEGNFWEWKLNPGSNNYIEMNKGIIMLWKNERWL